MIVTRLWWFVGHSMTKQEVGRILMLQRGLSSFSRFLLNLRSAIIANFADFNRKVKIFHWSAVSCTYRKTSAGRF